MDWMGRQPGREQTMADDTEETSPESPESKSGNIKTSEKKKLVILEQRNAFQAHRSETSSDEVSTAPNSDVDEGISRGKWSQRHNRVGDNANNTESGPDEEENCLKSSPIASSSSQKAKKEKTFEFRKQL